MASVVVIGAQWGDEAKAKVVDLLQIPAFLCRQTDLLVAAVNTGKPILIKKGHFMAPEDMATVLEKAVGAVGLLLAERGAAFGYHRLVVDMRSLAIIRPFRSPKVYDATHSVHLPRGTAATSAGHADQPDSVAGGGRRQRPLVCRASG